MSDVHFRHAVAADARLFAGLHALCFVSPWDAEAFAGLLKRKGAFGLLAWRSGDPAPAGFALLERVEDEAEILTLGVRPDCRKQGIAAGLLAQGCGELARLGARCVHLEVAADNEAALALYRRTGFAETGRRPAYYRRGAGAVDGLILTRRFAPPLVH
jgi:ribosomal-protein-alanine N-acetyltransferase